MIITVKGPKLNSETIDVKEGTIVSDILKEYSDRMPYPIYLSKVNN